MYTKGMLERYTDTIEDEAAKQDAKQRLETIQFENALATLTLTALMALPEEELKKIEGLSFDEAKETLLNICNETNNQNLKKQIEAITPDMQIAVSCSVEDAFEGSAVDMMSIEFYNAIKHCLSPQEIIFFGGEEQTESALENAELAVSLFPSKKD